MNIIFLGAPGSGKGTQAGAIIDRYGLASVSMGDMLRQAVSDNTSAGKTANEFMSAGKLVPDEIVVKIIEDRLAKSDCANGFLMDGFPRSIVQAKVLDEMLNRTNKKIDHVVFLDVKEEELVTRLKGRGRSDDTEETVRARLQVYRQNTEPLVEYYKSLSLLRHVDGAGDLDSIASRIANCLHNAFATS